MHIATACHPVRAPMRLQTAWNPAFLLHFALVFAQTGCFRPKSRRFRGGTVLASKLAESEIFIMKTITWREMSFILATCGAATVALAQENLDVPNGVQPSNPNNPAAGSPPAMQNSRTANEPTRTAQDQRLQNGQDRSFPVRVLDKLTAQQFVTDAAMGGMKEVQLSQIALAETKNQNVRRFADRMVRDHSAANARLENLAREKGLDFPATNTFALDDANWNNPIVTGAEMPHNGYLMTTNLSNLDDYRDFRELKSLSGHQFDVSYARDMVADHINTINEFEVASHMVTDPDLKRFADQTLPVLRMHSQMAQQLANELTGVQPMNNETNSLSQQMGYSR